MSNLSKSNLNEIGSIYSNITLSESTDVLAEQNPITQRLVSYGKGTLSPIIKKTLKLDPTKPLATGLLKKGVESATTTGTKVVRDIGSGITGTARTAYRQGRAVASKLKGFALPVAATAAGIDLTAPMRGERSRILDYLKPKYEESSYDGNILTEEVANETCEHLCHLIGSYLIENKLADNGEKAIKIMENMSDKWAEEILISYLNEEGENNV